MGVALTLNICRQLLRIWEGYDAYRVRAKRNADKTPEQLALESTKDAMKEQKKQEVQTLDDVLKETSDTIAMVHTLSDRQTTTLCCCVGRSIDPFALGCVVVILPVSFVMSEGREGGVCLYCHS